MSALAASMRKRGLDVRAGGPRRSQASSLRTQVAPARLGDRSRPIALGLRQHVGRVATVVGRDRAAADLPRRLADRVQEPAVVGDDEQRPAASAQVLGQPVDSLYIEVVGRLVQHQQVGALDRIGDQQGAQGSAPPLAARHDRQLRVEPVPQPQPVEHLAGGGVACPLVLGQAGKQQLTDRRVRQRVVLRQQRDADSGTRRDASRIGRFLPGDNPRKSALTGAVSADDTDTIAVVDPQRHPVQKQRGAPGSRDGVEGDKHSAAQVSGASAERRIRWLARPPTRCAC